MLRAQRQKYNDATAPASSSFPFPHGLKRARIRSSSHGGAWRDVRSIIGQNALERVHDPLIHGPEHDGGLDTEIQEIKKSPPASRPTRHARLRPSLRSVAIALRSPSSHFFVSGPRPSVRHPDSSDIKDRSSPPRLPYLCETHNRISCHRAFIEISSESHRRRLKERVDSSRIDIFPRPNVQNPLITQLPRCSPPQSW